MESEFPNVPQVGSVDRSAVLRVVDANLNRSGEAFRVVEDSLRFVVCDRCLTADCKSVRHDLGILASELRQQLHPESARDAAGDIGANNDQASEYGRAGVEQVIAANFSRARESLRALEEFSKLLDSKWAMQFEKLRYRVYDIERAVVNLLDSKRRLAGVTVCVLVDSGDDRDSFGETVRAILAGGAQMIQLRDKIADNRILLERACQLVEMTRRHSAISIVNDRIDIAVASGADGVHLGQEDLPVIAARKTGGARLIVGVSTHSVEQARQAVRDGASYIGVGPTFESTTKSFGDFPGIELVRQVAEAVSIPAMAIGGITIGNIDLVLEAGLGRIAVSGGVLRADVPIENATRCLVERLSKVPANNGVIVNAGD